MNTVWAMVGFVILALFSLVEHRSGRQASRVPLLFNLVWGGALLLIAVGAIRYTPASAASWVALLLALFVFNFGALLALGGKNTAEPASQPNHLALVTPQWLAAITVIYFVGFAVYLVTIDTSFGLEMLWDDPESVRADRSDGSYLSRVPLWARALLYLGPLLVGLYGYRRSCTRTIAWPIRFTMLAAVAVTQLAMLQRTNLFLGILFLISLLISDPKDPLARGAQFKKTAGVLALVAVLFVGFQSVGSALGKTGASPRAIASSAAWVYETGMYSPIMYYTSGPMALMRLMDSQDLSWPASPEPGYLWMSESNPQTWGATSLGPLVKVIPIAEAFPAPAPFVDVGVLTNVYTWFEPAYRDFREVGMVAFSATMGWLLTYLYRTRNHSTRRFWAQSWLLSLVFVSTFVSKLVTPAFIAVLALIVLLGSRRRAEPEEHPTITRALTVKP